ncbi:MAG: hypothetical protein WB507_03985 [Solirubrobacterales bacterium]
MLRKPMIAATLALVLLIAAAGAYGLAVRGTNFVFSASGGVAPTSLPHRTFAPIQFQGQVNISPRGGGAVPPALEAAVLDFDREGRLNTRGLPTCPVSAIAQATPQEARQVCQRSIVGTGRLEAATALPGQGPVIAGSPLTLFNGVRQNGDPTVVLHAQITAPVTQTFAVVVPIEKLSGSYGYRATIDVPPIAGGYGALTYIDVKVGRSYRANGQKLNYISARCSRGLFEARGKFTASGGSHLALPFYKPCRAQG